MLEMEGASATKAAASPEAIAHSGEQTQRQVPNDNLLACFEILLEQHTAALNLDALVAGLTGVSEAFHPAHLREAAKRAGFSFKQSDRRAGDLPSATFPLIMADKESGYIVLLEKYSSGEVAAALPETGGGTILLSPQEVAERQNGPCYLMGPLYFPQDRRQSNATGSPASAHWLRESLRPTFPHYLWIALAAGAINLLALTVPLFTMNVYDRVLPNAAFATLWALSLGVALALGFDLTLRIIRSWLAVKIGEKSDIILSSKLYNHILKLEFNPANNDAGGFVQRLRDYETLRDFFSSTLALTLTDVAFTGIFISIIFLIGGPMAVPPLVAITLVILTGLILQPYFRKMVTKTNRERQQRNSLLLEAVTGTDTIKIIRAEGRFAAKWEAFCRDSNSHGNRLKVLAAFSQHLTGLIAQGTTISMIIVGAYLYSENVISLGAIIASVILASRAIAPLSSLSSLFVQLQSVRASIAQLNEIMARPCEPPLSRAHISQKIARADVALENIKFSFEGSRKPAVEIQSLHIAPGEKVAIIGRVGSGKTTLGKLLCRLYKASEGTISIDGIDIEQFPPAEVRRAVYYSAPEAALFQGTLRENICLANPRASDGEALKAARITGADRLIRNHPRGIQQEVYEGGRNYSAGQRQLILLTRAALGNPPLLFLDEPTGSLDPQTEQAYLAALPKIIRPEQTLIITSHRSAPLALVQRLIVMDQGKIVADGPRDEILRRLSSSN
ncbi:type I secretion system permease/ATPase [Rhodobacteraceae bacterium RKSG542]|uniref:type I secretion system permease/ATPase n=1 Tax=Pseudovibrio flavus TaxID=2529854 RepID=UPI0012BBAA11|nr:type I secretion system permease/ATPase [Pseudovibrio flavus]MTI16070.1 type I secretion system permease/ATPase [Pseudovibrio flavus]